MIMLVGVTTVFVALFLIIIFLLGFPRFFAALKRKEHGHPAPLPQIVEVTKKSAKMENAGAAQEDESLIAVLTAAVAAASGSKPGSFAITQVRQAPAGNGDGFNTPVWGRVERLARK
jgi:Na+-transporting methylmalonyl-CoA/oxaloacetate decarboxylase gamma subunit